MMKNSSIDSDKELAFNLVNFTDRNIFVTGKAGTGKTTFLKRLQEESLKNIITVAPTGVASINARGVTIHSLFLFPFSSFIPTNDYVDRNVAMNRTELVTHFKYSKEKRKLLSEVETLVIDEVSMVRCDLLDAIDFALRIVRKNEKPFGGVQVVMLGDMYQLPPVTNDRQWGVLRKYYKSPFFFDSHVLTLNPPVSIEFKTVYRQTDPEFINLLNAIRHQKHSEIDFELLNDKYDKKFPSSKEGYITLTSHNKIADTINQEELSKIKTKEYSFEADVSGTFAESAFPTEKELILKEDTQVMFVKNDSSGKKRFFNGKIGKIASIDYQSIQIDFGDDSEYLKLEKEEWKNIRYTLNKETGKIEEEDVGSFTQYPIKLAWAITIHKSQGLTFDRAIIDAGRSFAPGQVYVALSRCRNLEGMVLKSVITEENIIHDIRIERFQKTMWDAEEVQKILETEKYTFAVNQIFRTLNLESIKQDILDWQTKTNKKTIPEKESVLNLISKVYEPIDSLTVVGRKFENTINKWLRDKEPDEAWAEVDEKTTSAVEYFCNTLFSKVWQPIFAHYDEYKNKSKITLYLRVVQELLDDIQIKIEQINDSELLDRKLSNKEYVFSSATIISKEEGGSIEATLMLFSEGKNIHEIAKERNLSQSTISNHIAQLIAKNKLSVLDFVSQEKCDQINATIAELGGAKAKLKEIKDALPEEVSYDDIKFVRSANA